MKCPAFAAGIAIAVAFSGSSATAAEPLQIGSSRQLFVDRHLIEDLTDVRLVLHQPVRREIAIANEFPWERFGVSYMTVFRDGEKFRAWYRADGADFNKGKRRAMTAYAESEDGVHWHKPKLGLIEFDGSKENNLIWDGPGANMSVFKDGNPHAPDDERYKAFVRAGDILGLVSPDGVRWRLLQKAPLLTDRPFDSHNIVYWDERAQEYVAYTRGIRTDGKLGHGATRSFKEGVRWIRRSTSKDFRNWSPLVPITTGNAPLEQLYTNSAIPYPRAPQYVLMFPSRFVDAREPQPGWIGGKGVSDIVFLSSRDGLNFDRTFPEAFVRPGPDTGNWHERAIYMERGILQTAPAEMSLFAMENWRLPSVNIRRLTLRPAGFVSVNGPYAGGELLTKSFVFTGDNLRLNYATSAAGSLRAELQDASGQPLPGFSIDDCPEMFGDRIDGEVNWSGEADLSKFAGMPLRLRCVLKDAALYSFRLSD